MKDIGYLLLLDDNYTTVRKVAEKACPDGLVTDSGQVCGKGRIWDSRKNRICW